MNLLDNNYYILASSQLFPFINADLSEEVNDEAISLAHQAYKAVKQEDYADAIDVYGKAISLYPDQPFFYACRSILHRFNGDDESSFYDYQVAKRMDFNYHHFMEWLENQGEMLESEDLQDFSRITQETEDDAQQLINRALLQVQHFNFAEAISDYSKAFILSNDSTILISRAAIYMRVLKYDKALADLNLVLSIQKIYDAYLYRAKLYVAIKECDLALQDLDAAMAMDSSNPTAYEERAQLFEQLEQFDKAITDYTKLISLNTGDFYPYVLRADLFEKTENWKQAIADYSEAIRLNPYYSDLYQYRGELLEKIGDVTGAQADFAVFKELEDEE